MASLLLSRKSLSTKNLARNSASEDSLKRLQLLESENQRLMDNQATLIQETNIRMQNQLQEIRTIKEDREKLRKETAELRDLCCFLDDDRQRTKRLSKEWQRFGKYTTNIMKQEVAAYQGKLTDLERMQSSLIEENTELKQLCLYLDERRTQPVLTCPSCGLRQNNDSQTPPMPYSPPSSSEAGSTDSDELRPESEKRDSYKMHQETKLHGFLKTSQSKSAWYEMTSTSPPMHRPMFIEPEQIDNESVSDAGTSDHGKRNVLEYIKSLEDRVIQLERGPPSASNSEPSDPQHQTSSNAAMPGDIIQNQQSSVMTESQQSSASSCGTLTSYGSSAASGNESDTITALYMPPNLGESNETLHEDELEDMVMNHKPIARTPHRLSRRFRNHNQQTDQFASASVRRSTSEPSDLNVNVSEEDTQTDDDVICHQSNQLTRATSMYITSNMSKQVYDWKHALKVLELQEIASSDQMKDDEKAILQQMCKVAWKCLDRGDRENSSNKSSNETLTTTTVM